MKRIFSFQALFFLFLLLCAGFESVAQSSDTVEMADILRSSGKIYVVVAVMSVVFIGIACYLFTIDKRLQKLENNMSTKH